MIDIHCHILPGVDDGASDLAMAVEMARVAARDGVRTIVATPHHGEPNWPERRRLLSDLATLRSCLHEEGIAVDVLLGAEVFVSLDLGVLAAAGKLPVIGEGPYVLVEFPFSLFPNYAEHVLFELQVRGFKPIVAHPERCEPLQRDVARLAAMVDRGMLVQINAGSLTGVYGGRVRAAARQMVLAALAHVIASDGHGVKGRGPGLSTAVAEASRLVGLARAEAMVTAAPAAIIKGEGFALPPTEKPSETRRWAWPRLPFRRR
ncbi:MAG: tyrosine-protein phosphatase [Chloroflexota bacterium]